MFALRFIGLAFLVAVSWNMGQLPMNELNPFGKIVASCFFLAAPALYLLPTFEAWKKGHTNLTAIALINVFLGWSLIGWVAAIVWAFKRPEPAIAPVLSPTSASDSGSVPQPNHASKVCPFCAENIMAAAIKCKHCGSEIPKAEAA